MKKKMERCKFPFKPQSGGKPPCFGMQTGLLQKGIGNKPSLKQLGLIPIRVRMQDQMVSSPVTILFFIYIKTHFYLGKKKKSVANSAVKKCNEN